MLGFLRIVSSEIHVAGRPPSQRRPDACSRPGLEGDVIKLTADVLTTGPGRADRRRLPFNNIQGSQTSIPGLTLAMSPTALAQRRRLRRPRSRTTSSRCRWAAPKAGFLTARPKGTSGDTGRDLPRRRFRR
jgi:hypothetical protein